MLIDALTKFVERGDERWASKEASDAIAESVDSIRATVDECARKSEVVTEDRVSELIGYASERLESATDSKYALKGEAVGEDRVREIVEEMSDEFHSATMYFGNQASPTLKKINIGVVPQE
jgi:hypothetical protein